jgi:hypothetical protein
MNDKQRELFDRLKRATETIWKNPKTATEVTIIFEEFVSSIEQIATDLAVNIDEQVARDLQEIISSCPA